MTFNWKLFAMLYMYAKCLRLPLAKMAKFPSKCRRFRRRILGEYYSFLTYAYGLLWILCVLRGCVWPGLSLNFEAGYAQVMANKAPALRLL